MSPGGALELRAADQRLGTLAVSGARTVGHDLVLECHRQRPVRPPGRRAAGEALHLAVAVRCTSTRASTQRAINAPSGDCDSETAVVGAALRERGEREPVLAAAGVGENELAARAESAEQGGGVAPSGVVLGGRCGGGRSGLVVAADAVRDRRGGHDGRRHGPDHAELGYPATSAAAAASCSPNRARGTNWPIPGFATTSPPSTITLPRRSTVSTSPTTSVPS